MAKRDEVGSRIFDYKGYRPAGKDFSPPAELDDLTEILETGVERIKKIMAVLVHTHAQGKGCRN